ncbi:MAG: hypothetical protein JNJ99_00730, partial [Crocinitomicaceae bacterium]|nr:hypothetical protein [Crocinitomicaceae bacterium]
VLISCSGQSITEPQQQSVNTSDLIQFDGPVCPEGHTDSIIPVLYGFPDERSFERADSGLIFLGGCELSDENWYCKIHDKTFP